MKRYFTILIGLLLAVQVAAQKRASSKQQVCSSESYSSEVVKETQISETCVQYEIKVSYDGVRTYGLSHYSIAIPCGTIKDAWNSEGWDMDFGKDRKTGVYGLKVDDINGFGKGESFTVKFTWCSDNSCEKELGVVASKYGQCVDYDTLSNNNEPEPPAEVCSSLLASLQKKNVTCPNGNDGEMQVVIQEGKEPFVYTWSNGSNTATAQNLKVGNYAVTIKDADGNTLTLNDVLSGPPPIVITETVVNPTCSGLSNGSIDLEVSGGTGSYSYQWNHGPTTQDQANLPSGLYTVAVTDSLGCSLQKTFMLTNGTLLSSEAVLTQPSCSGNDGAIDITPIGGTAPYTYRWNTSATTQDLQNIGAGFFRITITDANGCSAVRSQTLQINNTLAPSYIVIPTSCLGDNSGAIDLAVSGGTGPYTTVWTDGPTTEDRSGLTAGNYQVTVTDATGCSRILDITVYKKPLEVTTTVNQPSCSGDTGSVTVEPVGGVPPYTYNWSNGDTDNTAEGLVPGVYSVTITDGSGCSTDQFFGIIAPVPMQVFGEVTNAQCGANDSYAISLTVFGGKYPYSYSWSNGATIEDISGLAAGIYTVHITDAASCVAEKTFTIEPVLNGACLINAPTVTLVCQSVGNIITTAVTGATTYSWTVTSSDNSWVITSGSSDSSAVYTVGAPGSTATFTLNLTKNGCTQTCSYTVTSGCVERDNTGGGDPTSSEPCKPATTTTPPVVESPEPPQDPETEEPAHGCKPRVVHIYPNPFKEKVTFEWTASKNEHVRLEIYDSRGNRVAVVYEGAVKAGQQYSYYWYANGESGGKDRFYYYRFTTSKGVDSGKLVRK